MEDCGNFEDTDDINNIIILNDENGNEVRFEFLDLFEYDNNEYVVLLPTDTDEKNESEVVILKVEVANNDNKENYVSIDDEGLLDKIFQLFKEKFKGGFNFTDV